jgi:hypothetical protein
VFGIISSGYNMAEIIKLINNNQQFKSEKLILGGSREFRDVDEGKGARRARLVAENFRLHPGVIVGDISPGYLASDQLGRSTPSREIDLGDIESLIRDHIEKKVAEEVAKRTIELESRTAQAEREAEDAKRGKSKAEASLRTVEVKNERLEAELSQGTPAEVRRLEQEVAKIGRERLSAEGEARRQNFRANTAEDRARRAEIRVAEAERRAQIAEELARQEKIVRQRAEREATRQSTRERSTSNDAWDPEGYYKILGIADAPTARRISNDQLRRLFRTLSMIHHPDQGGETRYMQQLSKAFDFLSNPQNRTRYGR